MGFLGLDLGGLFGGDSSGVGNSKSSSSTASNDARVVGAEGSTNTSTVITGNSNTMTDYGAVKESLQLAKAGIEGAYTYARESQAANGDLLSGALKQSGQAQQQFATALENVKTSDVRVLIITGLAVVGLAAVWLAKKG